MVVVTIGYFVVTCYLYAWKLRQHKRFPIRVVQIGMLLFRLQVSLWVLMTWLLALHGRCPLAALSLHFAHCLGIGHARSKQVAKYT